MKRIRILTSQATPGMVISDDVYTTEIGRASCRERV